MHAYILFGATTFSIVTLSIKALNTGTLSVIMLIAIMPNISYAECCK
jgi:hypothetical protein